MQQNCPLACHKATYRPPETSTTHDIDEFYQLTATDANGKVKIKAICFDKKKEVYETVSITDLLNKNVYTVINNHMTCTDCFGSGKFSNTSERTVWDATISAGAKIIGGVSVGSF